MIGVRDAVAAAPYVPKVVSAVGGPKAILGRLLGFGAAEMRVGVPAWAWFTLGAAAGATGMWMGKDRIQRLLKR